MKTDYRWRNAQCLLVTSRCQSRILKIFELIVEENECEESDGKGRKSEVISCLSFPSSTARALRLFPFSPPLALLRLQCPLLKVRAPQITKPWESLRSSKAQCSLTNRPTGILEDAHTSGKSQVYQEKADKQSGSEMLLQN